MRGCPRRVSALGLEFLATNSQPLPHDLVIPRILQDPLHRTAPRLAKAFCRPPLLLPWKRRDDASALPCPLCSRVPSAVGRRYRHSRALLPLVELRPWSESIGRRLAG